MELMKQCLIPEQVYLTATNQDFDSVSPRLATGSKDVCDPPAAKISRRRSEIELQSRVPQQKDSQCCFLRINMKEKEQFVYIPSEESGVTPLIVSYSPEKTTMWLQPRVTQEEQESALESMKRNFSDLGVSNSSPLAGTGASAVVLKTFFEGKDVAVKVYRQGNTERYCNNELSVLSQIGVHPNLIGIYGYCSNPFALLMEFSELGSLFDILHNERDLVTRQTVFGGNTLVSTTTEACATNAIAQYGSLQNAIVMHREQLAMDIARGMAHLHSHHCVHLDLTSRNILITSDFHAKITDFGLSVMTIDGELASRQLGHAPSYWKAPELGHRAPSCVLPSPVTTPTLVGSVAETPSVSSPAVPSQNTGLSDASSPSPPSTPAPLAQPSPVNPLMTKKPKRLFTPKVDVFSYGVVLWELFHPGKFPWNGDLHPTYGCSTVNDQSSRRLCPPAGKC